LPARASNAPLRDCAQPAMLARADFYIDFAVRRPAGVSHAPHRQELPRPCGGIVTDFLVDRFVWPGTLLHGGVGVVVAVAVIALANWRAVS
jgi:hypothetical protein